MVETNGKKHWTENFRLITPVLVTIAVFQMGVLISTVNKIDDKLFKHLTNDEIHIPRSVIVEKASFDLYQKMRDAQMDSIDKCILEIRSMLRDYYGK